MKKLFFLSMFLLVRDNTFSQQDSTKGWVRAFPITDYMIDLTDSVKLIQIHLYEGTSIKEKQVGLLKGIYRDRHSDTMTIGAGRCYLIKGEYYYFTVNYKQTGILPREGDLVYTFVEKPKVYKGQIIMLATYFIGLQSVYEERFFDRYFVFREWTKQKEEALIDSLLADIHFTGNYFLENNPGMNVKVTGGRYDGEMVLTTMIKSTRKDLTDFLDYIIARPRLYAGKEWKISEIFATWLSAGAPSVIKE